MIKILIKNILIFLVFVIFGFNFSFANSGETIDNKPKTIKQLKENIEILKSKKVINSSILEKFKLEHGGLQDYFSKNLISSDYTEIEKILSNYKKEKELIISSKNKDEQQKLLDLEIEFFNSLLPYIDKEKLNLYNILREKSILSIKKEIEIKSKIKENKIQINKKVSVIKQKIKENEQKQQEKIDLLLKIKIKTKLLKIQNSQRFSKFSKEEQKDIFKLILKKIKIRKENNKNLSQKKLKLYSIIEEVLIEVINEL